MKHPAIYITTNKRNGTLYTGVTSNLSQRIYQHKMGHIKGFSSQYGCHTLVYFELHSTIDLAIQREKEIKGKTREFKLKLIESFNPTWRDLFEEVWSY